MGISMDAIKELREMTSCGVIECKKALEEASGDFKKAKEILQQRGLELAAKKGSRLARDGRLEAYIHPGNKLGVIVELAAETDFVAKSDAFCAFTKDLAMHIAATNPKYIKKEDVPAEVLSAQANQKSFLEESCLTEQAFIKDPSKTIQECINMLISKVGENIYVNRFIRFKVGEVE